jgi:molybdopterin molybdotransferase
MLPGGPPSNLVAFLQIVLPALRKLSGHDDIFLPGIPARIDRAVEGQADWTQAIFGRLIRQNGQTVFSPAENMSRLKNMADAAALLLISEGIARFEKGARVHVQRLE